MPKPSNKPPDETLRQMYSGTITSNAEIAKEYGVDECTASRWMTNAGVRRQKTPPDSLLWELKYKKNLSYRQIANLLEMRIEDVIFLMGYINADSNFEEAEIHTVPGGEGKNPGLKALNELRATGHSWAVIGKKYGVKPITARGWFIDAALYEADRLKEGSG